MSTAQKKTKVTEPAENKPVPFPFVKAGDKYTKGQAEYICAVGGVPSAHDTAVRLIGKLERDVEREKKNLDSSREEVAVLKRALRRRVLMNAGLERELIIATHRLGRMCQCTRVDVLTAKEVGGKARLIFISNLMVCDHCDGNGLLPKPHGNKKVEGSDADQG